jgi:drug/metabolite transporter (DMT)-like permease
MNRRSWLLMALLAALWGASYLFIKVNLDDGMSPVFLVFARLSLGALVLMPLALREGALTGLGRYWRAILFVAIVQVVVPFLLIAFGQRHIASSLAGILIASSPMFTALIAARFDAEERPYGIAISGVAIGLVGVVLLFGVDLSGDAKALAGGLMVVLAALGYAIGSLYLKHGLRGVPPVGIAASTIGLAALLMAPFAPFALPGYGPSTDALLAMLALGAGSSGVGFWIYFTLLRDVGPGRASLVAMIGLALIVLGSWIAAESRLPGRARAAAVAPPVR